MIVNLQKRLKLELPPLREFVEVLRSSVSEIENRDFSVALVSDSRMKSLNKLFRSKDSTTDVLSFPRDADDFDPGNTDLGDIVISVEQAQKQAVENSLSFDTEIRQLILHGALHLCGYDHETDSGEMNRRELELRDELQIQG